MPRRRGDGSVYQDRQGYWCAEVPTGGGKVARTRRKRKADAEAWRAEVVARRESGLAQPASSETLAELLERFLRVRGSEVAPRTLKAYQRHAGAACKHLGHVLVRELTTRQLRDLCQTLRAEGATGHTPNHVKAVLHNALEIAIEDGIILRNPAAFRLKRVGVATRQALSAQQMAAFLLAVEGDRLEALWHILALYGCRRGELLGLAVADLDLAAGVLAVTQAVDEQGALVPLKNTAARRVLPLVEPIASLLALRLAAVDTERQADGWREHGLIFPSEVGTPIRPRNLDRRYKTLRERAGLPRSATMHTWRHTAATDYEASGAPLKSTQRILGHASISTTLGIYAHGRSDADRQATENLVKLRTPHKSPNNSSSATMTGGAARLPDAVDVARTVRLERTTNGLEDYRSDLIPHSDADEQPWLG